MSLFFFCDHSVEPEGIIQFWQKDQLVELCLLGCFSSKANSPLFYLDHSYFSKHLEIHCQYLTEPKLFWGHICQFALAVLFISQTMLKFCICSVNNLFECLGEISETFYLKMDFVDTLHLPGKCSFAAYSCWYPAE